MLIYITLRARANEFISADIDGDGQLTVVEFFINMQVFRDTVKAFDNPDAADDSQNSSFEK